MRRYLRKELCQPLMLGMCVLGVIVLRCFYITRTTGPFIYADELGYWSHAAHMMGNTWAGVMDGVSWYSFGYSFWLALTFLFSDRMLVMYRIAIVINMCMGVCMFALAYRIIKKLLPEQDVTICGLLAFAVTSYPTYIFYSYTTLSETVFAMVVWLLFYEVILMEEHPTMIRAIVLGCTMAYGFMVHNRMLAVLGAVGFCLLILWIKHEISWKYILFTAVSAIIGLVAYLMIKNWLDFAVLQNEVMSSTGGEVTRGSYNTFAYAFKKFVNMFQWSSIKKVLVNVMGQVWEGLSSSYLLVGPGIIYCLKRAWSREKAGEAACLYIYPLMCLICSMGMTGIVAYGGFNLPKVGEKVRLDVAFLGRYNAPLIPLLLLMTCVVLLRNEYRFVWKCYAGTLLIYLFVSIGMFIRLHGVENGYLNIVSTVAIHIFHWLGNFSVIKCVCVALLVSIIFIGLFSVRWKRQYSQCVALLMLIFLFSTTALYCMRLSIRGENDNTARYAPMFEYLTENTEKGEVVYICQDGKMSYDLQTRLVDKAVISTVLERLSDVGPGTYVVLRKEQLDSYRVSDYEICLENEEFFIIKKI